jgi:hypothetical protein
MRTITYPIILIAIALTVVAGPCGAAGKQDGERITITDAKMGGSCTGRNAEAVDLQTLAADPRKYDGKCVRVSGLWIGPALYSGIEGYYRVGPVIGRSADPSAWTHRIGVYVSERIEKRAKNVEAADADVIGTAGVCEDLWSFSETMITMAIGYCHYLSGGYVKAAAISFREVPFIRQAGEAARQQFGNLAPPPKGWTHLAEVEALAQRWLKDIQTGDVDDFLALHGLISNDIDLDDKENDFHQVFRAKKSPFASFRGASSTPQSAIFVVERPQAPDAEPMPPNDYAAVACYCRETDCSARWPISLADASSAKTRPFICGQFFTETEDGNTERFAHTVIDWRNLEEPEISGAN